jgi:dihydroorotate dehydrogenase electron transfer subunit
MPGTRLLFLDCPDLAANAQPGQFVMIRCGAGYDPYLPTALPIHRLHDGGISLLFRPVDAALSWLEDRHVGDAVDLLGPAGRGFDLSGQLGSLSLIAWSMGVAPLLSILDRSLCPAQLLLIAPTQSQIYPRELLPRQVEYLPYVGQAHSQEFWQMVRRACRWGQRVFAAGPDVLYRRLREMMELTRLSAREGQAQVWIEAEQACGRGVCGACRIETRSGARHVCTDGPAFDLADLILD